MVKLSTRKTPKADTRAKSAGKTVPVPSVKLRKIQPAPKKGIVRPSDIKRAVKYVSVPRKKK